MRVFSYQWNGFILPNIGRAVEFNENLSRIRNNGGQWRIYNADMQPVINPMIRVQIQIYE